MKPIALAALLTTALGGAAHAGPLHRAGEVIRLDALRTRAAVNDTAMKAVGYAELAGLRFPVRNYQAKVAPKLWRGSRLDNGGLADLKARGFSAVVGLTAERDLDKNAPQVGIDHLRIPILDNGTPSVAQVKEFLSFVKTRESQGPIYVHCEAGVGRTGIMVAAYRMKVEHWSAGQAIVEARKYGMKERSQVMFIRDLYKNLDKI